MNDKIKVATVADLLNEEIVGSEQEPVPAFKKVEAPVGALTEDGTLTFIIDLFGKLKSLHERYNAIQGQMAQFSQAITFQEEDEETEENLVLQINESEYIKIKEFVVNEVSNIRSEIEAILSSREYICFDAMFTQWADFRNQMDDACDNVIMKQSQLEVAQEKITNFIELFEDFEAEVFEGEEIPEINKNNTAEEDCEVKTISGSHFKSFIKQFEIISITGVIFISGDTTKEDDKHDLFIDENNRISPKTHLIEDDSILVIEDICYYDREDGLIKKEI